MGLLLGKERKKEREKSPRLVDDEETVNHCGMIERQKKERKWKREEKKGSDNTLRKGEETFATAKSFRNKKNARKRKETKIIQF